MPRCVRKLCTMLKVLLWMIPLISFSYIYFNNQPLLLMPSSLLSHVPAKELWLVWSLPPRPKCFNQARILNEWRPRVCWREEEEGRQFLEMITDSFPCLSCLWKRETPTPPNPLALHSTPPPHELLQDLSLPPLYFSMIVAPLLNIWHTRSSLPLLLFMSGA